MLDSENWIQSALVYETAVKFTLFLKRGKNLVGPILRSSAKKVEYRPYILEDVPFKNSHRSLVSS